ncbi:hypothetical protein ABH920_000311 [Catenulispora sp. EB89]|uniref:hypothetical protein n=1 Tax=Catenulispora sp. EB89 TaxID=3156257 RepID=UPI0035119252
MSSTEMLNGLRLTLRGIRDEIQPLANRAGQLETELAGVRAELEPRTQLAAWLETELVRRQQEQGDSSVVSTSYSVNVHAEQPIDRVMGGHAGRLPVPPQSVGLLRGPSRQQIAEELLTTVAKERPIVARDVAERYGLGVDRSQRESARAVLNRLVAQGKAVRLADGSFIPPGAQDRDSVQGQPAAASAEEVWVAG